MNQPHKNTVENSHENNDPEIACLKEALKRTYMERLLFATKLYKVQQTFKKATYTHKAYKPASHS